MPDDFASAFGPAPEPAKATTTEGGGDFASAFGPAPLGAGEKAPPEIDPITGRPWQYATAGTPTPVGQSTGMPIAEGQYPGPLSQAKINLATDPEQRRRIAAADLFPSLSPTEAQARVFYGDEGRLAAVDPAGRPYYVDPKGLYTGSLISGDYSGPSLISGAFSPSNLLAVAGKAIPGTAEGAATGTGYYLGGLFGAGAGSAISDLARARLAQAYDPAHPLMLDPRQVGYNALANAFTMGLGGLGIETVEPYLPEKVAAPAGPAPTPPPPRPARTLFGGLPTATPEQVEAKAIAGGATPEEAATVRKIAEGGAPPSAPPPPPDTAAGAKAIAQAYYKVAEQSGGTLTPEFTNKFIDSVSANAKQTEAGQAVAGQNPISALADRLQTLRDKPMTLAAAQEVDEALGDLIDGEYGIKGLSKNGRKLAEIQSGFRDLIDNAQPGDITGGTEGFDALGPARKAWSQAMKMSDLERIQDRANMTDNPTTSVRTQLRTLLNNPAKVRGYSSEEIAALKDAADRGVLGSAIHVFGSRLVPLLAGSAEYGTHGLTAGLAAAGVTHLAGTKLRDLSNALQARRIGSAMDLLGQSVPPPPNPLNLP